MSSDRCAVAAVCLLVLVDANDSGDVPIGVWRSGTYVRRARPPSAVVADLRDRDVRRALREGAPQSLSWVV